MSPAPTVLPPSSAVGKFLRSWNLLLKSAQMYGTEHVQTNSKSMDAWNSLAAALKENNGRNLEFAVTEKRLLVNGDPVKIGPAEQSFVYLLAAADVASVTFTAQSNPESFLHFVRVFAENASEPGQIVSKLKQAIGDESKSGIRINEIRFVRAGSGGAVSGGMAATLLAESFGGDTARVEGLLNDPAKLLGILTAAGMATATPASGSGPGTVNESGSSSGFASPPPLDEEETTTAIRLLVKLAREGGNEGTLAPSHWREEFSRIPETSQVVLQRVLKEFAEAVPPKEPPPPVLLQMAEHLAVRLAMERYKSGSTEVDAVANVLNRMNTEIDQLRETLGTYEERLKQAGFELNRPPDVLEQEFWSRMPEPAKLGVLLSDEAWQIPSRHVRQYADHLAEHGETAKLEQILLKYVSCIQSESEYARKRVAVGLKDLAAFYPRPESRTLPAAIRLVGEQLLRETQPELQKLICSTFVLLGQEAATRRRYRAALEVVQALQTIEKSNEQLCASLHARIGMENRIPDFLEEALRMPEVPGELMDFLRRLPIPTAEHIAGRISRCSRRRERDRLVALATDFGAPAAEALQGIFRHRPPASAVNTVGLLSRIDPAALGEDLRARLPEWSRVYHDAVARQIAAAGSPSRGRLLALLLDVFDPLVVPLAIDEIGMGEDAEPSPLLLSIAGGELTKFGNMFVRAKALEALGRLRVAAAVPLLRKLAESEEYQGRYTPEELRVVAAQSLYKIDREAAKEAMSSAGFKVADLEPLPLDRSSEAPGVRQRYYPRLKLARELKATLVTADGELDAGIRELSLGGGLCSCSERVPPGMPATIRIKTGLRSFPAKVIIRDARSENVAFEIADMDLDSRSKLRALLQRARK
ncbi:MAG TPA: HEAT repeat domain-containing protein [Patescibacteria group bacterium]|nr:HEAT repeat domain-containing protein [Patescibacteria group bacterium]